MTAALRAPQGLMDYDEAIERFDPALGEERIYRVAAAFESNYAAAHSGLVPDSAPELEVTAR